MTDPLPQLTSRDWFRRGFRDALGFPALLLMATMCGIGGLVRDIGYPVWAGTLSTALIWAGPAQVIVFGAVASGAALPATAFAVWLSSSRFLPMTVSILPLIRSGGASMPQTLFAAHLVSMTTWVEGLRRLPAVPDAARWPYFIGFATVIISSGTLMTHAGYYLYAVLPKVIGAALLLLTPMFFSAAMVAAAKAAADWTALAVGFLLTPLLMPYLPSGVDFLVIGFFGGTLAFIVHKRRRAAS